MKKDLGIKEPKVRKEYLKKLERIKRGKFIKYSSIEDLRKAIEKI